MDRITEAYLNEFSAENNIMNLPQDVRFEHFTSYVVLRRQYSQTFDTADIIVGAGGDTGIDAIAIIVNGVLVTDVEEVTELAEKADYLKVLFLFVQAERSATFEGAKIATFADGVNDFFRNTPTLPRNERVAAAAEIMATIYRFGGKFKHGNPDCKLYYVTTGRWTGDANLEARCQAGLADLTNTNLFGSVDFQCLGADAIQRLYRESKNALSREFHFQNRIDIPEIPGIKEAYLGYVPVRQFINIITDEDGEILQSIFYDNVRDWQGEDNPVNGEIIVTLTAEHRNRFVLMNNGVTVIARVLRHAGSRFTIEDFQIVNGCQTSHAIFIARNQLDDIARDQLDDSVLVPMRLIVTEDERVIESIIHATNQQTAVRPEQFFAVTDFAKQLEEYFQTFPEKRRLFYERRSRQYDRLNIERTRIITPTNMIRAFAAMFLEEPHRTSRNYARVEAQVGIDIFAEGHKLEPYYVAGYALYKLEYLFRNLRLAAQYKPARYHMLLAVRILANPAPLPRINSNEMERYCKVMMQCLWNTEVSDRIFARAATIMDEVAGGNFSRDNIRTQQFTRALITRCREETVNRSL